MIAMFWCGPATAAKRASFSRYTHTDAARQAYTCTQAVTVSLPTFSPAHRSNTLLHDDIRSYAAGAYSCLRKFAD